MQWGIARCGAAGQLPVIPRGLGEGARLSTVNDIQAGVTCARPGWRRRRARYSVHAAAVRGYQRLSMNVSRYGDSWFNPSTAHQYSCRSETISRLAQQILCPIRAQWDTATVCWRWRRLTTPPRRPGPYRDRRSLPEHGADRAVPLGPHLDPLGPLLGQPHEQRHAGRHAVQFGVVLVAALELFA